MDNYSLPPVAPGYETPREEEEDLTGVLSNTCVLGRENLTQAMKAAMDAPFLRVTRILEPILMVLSLGLLIWAVAAQRGAGPILWGAFLLAMTAFFYLQQMVLYPRRAVKNQLTRQALEDGTAEPVNRLWFREENVANRRGEGDLLLHMGYDKVKRLTETDRLIVITTRRNRLIPLDKAGFQNGGPEEFWALMKRKAPEARVRRLG